MSDQPTDNGTKEQAARPNQTIRLSPEELKAIMSQAQQGQTEKKPWED